MRNLLACLTALIAAGAGLAQQGPPPKSDPVSPNLFGDGAAHCCSPDVGGRFWGGADSLLWWVKDGPLPLPLVTTGNPSDPHPGALGQPGTHVLFGDHSLD
ncbi:MAG TPA: hypothetical protein VKA46_02230 [Gemmataceae bacterium]|nr:hypothetical protein [Gemmataceae bacterium]